MARARKKQRPQGDAVDVDGAVLSSSAIIGGDKSSRRNLIVEGRINAELPLHAHGVAVGPTGQVWGDIYGAMIRIEGEVVGDLYAEVQVRVCHMASVRGNITAPKVILEEGAKFKGQISMQEPTAMMPLGLGGDGTTSMTA